MAMRRLTHQKMELFLRCQRKFRKTVSKQKGDVSQEVQTAKIIGKAVELATATFDPEERSLIVEAALQLLPDDQQTEALRKVETCVSRSDEIRSDEKVSAVRTQRQFEWVDPVTGWSLMAKPDFVRFARDARGPVIQIIDEKTAGYATTYQKRFLRFLGLVVAKQLEEEKKEALEQARKLEIHPTYTVRGFLAELVNEFGLEVLYSNTSIELVIRLLGDNSPPIQHVGDVKVGFVKRARLEEQLDEIREVISGIESAFKADYFPGKPAWHCEDCPFKADCLEYQAVVAARAQLVTIVQPTVTYTQIAVPVHAETA
jgi:PD-(D/E)XK nuclease superfamily